MPTFLELCQQFHQEIGAAGTISTVTSQTGMLKRYVDWIVKADQKIQSRKINWKFLWNEWELTLVENISEYSPPDGLKMFDEKSFWKGAGTSDAVKVNFIKHKLWRDSYRHSFIDADEVLNLTLLPNGKIKTIPAPDSTEAGSVITADYWRSPVKLVSNGQYSVIPEEFHDLIISQAKVYHAEYRHDSGAFNAASIEHETRYRDLKAHSLPGNEDENKSESSSMMMIEVS